MTRSLTLFVFLMIAVGIAAVAGRELGNARGKAHAVEVYKLDARQVDVLEACHTSFQRHAVELNVTSSRVAVSLGPFIGCACIAKRLTPAIEPRRDRAAMAALDATTATRSRSFRKVANMRGEKSSLQNSADRFDVTRSELTAQFGSVERAIRFCANPRNYAQREARAR
ncbi:MAG: hypothetical protein AAGJ53_04040 [Pseudomonadota bacterium]